MGCFGYICVGCGKSVRTDEKAVLKHYRHGELLGQTTGTYDSYGGVVEDETYRGHHDGINGHMSIWESEFEFADSKDYDARIYKGKPIKWMNYRKTKVGEGMTDLCDEMFSEWKQLPQYVHPESPKSGTQAWHKYCYDRASEEEKANLVLSEGDPDQSWGKPRKKYM